MHQPLAIGSCVVRNRLYRAPVLEGAGSGEGAAEIYCEAFEENARAGIGLIIQGNSCITPEGRSAPGMTLVDTREHTLALADATRAVHAHGAKIFLQIGHAGIYAMEGWNAVAAATRTGPLLAVSRPRVHVRPAILGSPVHVLTTAQVRELVAAFGRSAAWSREAGYDGVQLASANAKLIHQFLSPYYNHRRDEFGGSVRNRARILEEIALAVREQAGDDYPLAVKIPMDEDAPRLAPRISLAEGIELCRLAESFGYDAVTPVGLSVMPHASLCRGADPSDMLEVRSIRSRYEEALAGSRLKLAVVKWGFRSSARRYPFEPVWNRRYFVAAKAAVSIPVFAVGGIRSFGECLEILNGGQADMVGMARPFYAEPDLPARLLGGDARAAFCESSNRCVPAQMLGLKARCYNSNVARKREAARQTEPP
jgi:2,4-dienoyl-CoA reductase-like NADH-dependent reductase (Old Yellow Enzyme family)